ncbi:MAG: hypothetical protein IT431_11485 [Phycisphaerales bacterium]|nr:hypothetical protein [Phycisphaerales bacterium]
MHDRLVLGVDCGGTRTRAALATLGGRVLGVGEAGGGNPRDGGEAGTRDAVAGAVEGAFGESGLRRGPVVAAALGIAGVATDGERGAVRAALDPLSLAPAGSVRIEHDLRIAQAGAFGGGPGMVLIAGTGSCCYGRAADGREWRAGGWGGRLDDGGSATALGLAAVRAAIRAGDGRGPATVLGERVPRTLGVGDLRGVLRVVEGVGYRGRVANLGPVVTEAAREGDAVAVAIVEAGAAELADMVAAVARGLGGGAGGLSVACLGGVFRAGEVVLGPLRVRLEGLLERAPEGLVGGCVVVEASLPAVLGAVLLAAEVAGVGPGELGAGLASEWATRRVQNS